VYEGAFVFFLEVFMRKQISKVIKAWALSSQDLLSNLSVSFIAPAVIYFALGASGLTAIVGTFFVKEYLGLSAAFLTGIGFWAGIPWSLKVPIGHFVDVFWRWKNWLVVLGALLVASSTGIMVGLVGYTDFMVQHYSVNTWYVTASLLAPIGYVLQDVVADAMTVEAVSLAVQNDKGVTRTEADVQRSHQAMQTIGLGARLAGGIIVGLVNVMMFRDLTGLSQYETAAAYLQLYKLAMLVPAISLAGLLLGQLLGFTAKQVPAEHSTVSPDWIVLGGSLVYLAVVLALGIFSVPFNQELVFAVSAVIVVGLMVRVSRYLSAEQRRVFFGVGAVIFVFRAVPSVGPGVSWWEIDVLHFDQQFLARLMLIASFISLASLGTYAAFFAKQSLLSLYSFLAVAGFLLGLPFIGMYYGLHEWAAQVSHGLISANTIALVDVAMESPLGQVAMIPLMAWIAYSAPNEIKATFFAVVTSFSNLSGSLSVLFTKYLNILLPVSREVSDALTGAITQQADYSNLGFLMIVTSLIGLFIPLLSIWLVRKYIGEV
jgi:hypothetical protein